MTTTNHEKDGKAYASVRRVALALVLAASLLTCAHAWCVLTGLAWSAQPPTRTAAKLRQAPFVLGTDWGGVHSYSIPGELESNSTIKLAGVLHIYLKALKWPMQDGTYHLKMKGFVAFEAASYPSGWKYTFHNVAEIASLRLYVRFYKQGWQRELSIVLSDSICEQHAQLPNHKLSAFQACVDGMQQRNVKHYTFGDVSVDFGHTADVGIELLAHGWPRRISLEGQLQAALAAPPALADASSTAAFYRVLPTPMAPQRTIKASVLARILRWGDDYYKPLGLKATVLYVLPSQVAELEAHPSIRTLVATKRLSLVLWNELSHYQGWLYYDEQFVQSHSVLSHWGCNARVFVLDLDEFLVPQVRGDSFASMLSPGGCLASTRAECFAFQRWDVLPNNQLSDGSAAVNEAELWQSPLAFNPLLKYRYVSNPDHSRWPKLLMNATNAMPINVHWSSSCMGTSTVADNSTNTKLRSACDRRAFCPLVDRDCAYIAHVANMFGNRSSPLNATAIRPHDWLWMLEQSE